jgi:protein TonB
VAGAETPRAEKQESLVTAPELLEYEEPEYPEAALKARISGRVSVQVLVGIDGEVVESRINLSSGSADLDRAARTAAERCLFKPGTVDGEPARAWALIPYEFKLR